MRIGIDGRFWSEQGHGRYLRNLVKELAELDHENQYVLFLREKDFVSFQIPNSKFQKIKAEVRWYTLKEQIVLPWIYYQAKLDILHVPHWNVPLLYQKPFIVTIHDLTVSHFKTIRATTLPGPLWRIKRIGYHVIVQAALSRAKKIIAVSEFTKSEILKFYPSTPANKILVTLEAVEQSFIDQAHKQSVDDVKVNEVKQKYGITHQYLLYIGNVHPHKNIERLIKVFGRLVEQVNPDLQLVLVGKDDYFQKRLKDEISGKSHIAHRKSNEVDDKRLAISDWRKQIIWTGFVPDDHLIPLLKGASVFVFPSLMEGFGIPPLEAMACGTPTVVSNACSLPEVVGDASVTFEPTDEQAMFEAIKKVLENPDLRLKLIQEGYEQIRKFSWTTMAKQTASVYAEAIV